MPNLNKTVIASLMVGGVMFLSGCGQKNINIQDNNISKQNSFRGNNVSSTERFFSAGAKVTLADLVVGKTVAVMGTTNSDGTVSAARIMIGDLGDFMMRGITSTGQNFRSSSPDRQQPAASGGQFNGQRRPGGGNRMMGGGGIVRGEIISKDDASLVIKNQDGGSRIMFYSSKTEVYLFQTPTSTPSITTSSATNTQPEKI